MSEVEITKLVRGLIANSLERIALAAQEEDGWLGEAILTAITREMGHLRT